MRNFAIAIVFAIFSFGTVAHAQLGGGDCADEEKVDVYVVINCLGYQYHITPDLWTVATGNFYNDCETVAGCIQGTARVAYVFRDTCHDAYTWFWIERGEKVCPSEVDNFSCMGDPGPAGSPYRDCTSWCEGTQPGPCS